jgi:hypothetical protein
MTFWNVPASFKRWRVDGSCAYISRWYPYPRQNLPKEEAGSTLREELLWIPFSLLANRSARPIYSTYEVRPIGKALISGRSVSCSDYVACCCGTSSSSSSNVLIVELRDNGFGLKLGTIYTRI